MSYQLFAYLHLATVVPAFFLGTYLLLNRKGTPLHKFLGKIYMLLMLLTAFVAIFMPANIGPRILNHFGIIHIFSVMVIYFVPSAYFAAKDGNVKKHRSSMIGLYVGGLLIAGAFAFSPGRTLHTWLFGS